MSLYTKTAYNLSIPSKCDGHAKHISTLQNQVRKLQAQRHTMLVSRSSLPRAHLIDIEELSASISRYTQKIADLQAEEGVCEVDCYDSTAKEYDC